VQRVPVRIAIDPKDLAKHPLRVGLSMAVEVDLSSPARQPNEAEANAKLETNVFQNGTEGADALIHKIIEANLGS
jgi:membrane fusion protein (multidrug efflux system)